MKTNSLNYVSLSDIIPQSFADEFFNALGEVYSLSADDNELMMISADDFLDTAKTILYSFVFSPSVYRDAENFLEDLNSLVKSKTYVRI